MRGIGRGAGRATPRVAALTGIRRATGIPAVAVDDIAAAAAYYRDVLGFAKIGDAGADAAFVHGHGVTLLLRQAAGGERSRGVPDAVLLVDRPGRLRRLLDDRRADVFELPEAVPGRDDFFAVSDCYGNTLAVGPADRRGATISRRMADAADDARIRRHERHRAREESRHIERFRRFYDALPDRRNIYYLFFSEGLLHWVVKALSYVPRNVNLVLLGTDLPAAEVAWLNEYVRRPFHNVRLRIDDPTAWEFLFAVNRSSFGWLDSDCLVLNGDLFDELSRIDPRSSANCVWSWDSGFGIPLANTFFLFINADVIAALRERGLATSPSCYYYWWASLQVPGRRCYARRPTRAQLGRLRRMLPDGGPGRPATPYGMPYYDTTVMYQLMARACGYRIHRIRGLEGFGHIRGRSVQDESSDELLHIGGISKADALDEFSKYFSDQDIRLRYLLAEYITLAGIAGRLPPYYSARLTKVTAALANSGLDPQAAEKAVRQHLVEVRGMSTEAVDAVLRQPGGGPW